MFLSLFLQIADTFNTVLGNMEDQETVTTFMKIISHGTKFIAVHLPTLVGPQD